MFRIYIITVLDIYSLGFPSSVIYINSNTGNLDYELASYYTSHSNRLKGSNRMNVLSKLLFTLYIIGI